MHGEGEGLHGEGVSGRCMVKAQDFGVIKKWEIWYIYIFAALYANSKNLEEKNISIKGINIVLVPSVRTP